MHDQFVTTTCGLRHVCAHALRLRDLRGDAHDLPNQDVEILPAAAMVCDRGAQGIPAAQGRV